MRFKLKIVGTISWIKVVRGKFIILSIFLLVPFAISAQVLISEIMYDAPGADTGREWIEIENTSASPISLTGWKLNEQSVNHMLTVSQGTSTLLGGAFAIIASDPEKFRTDWPHFSGTIFDSSFSLSNTGETFSLRNNTSAFVDQISYYSSQGASGDGESLQRVGGSWAASSPTPGAKNVILPRPPAPPPTAASTQPPAKKVVSPTSSKIQPSVSNALPASSIATTSGYVLPVPTKDSSFKWYLLLGLVVVIGGLAYWIGGREKKKDGELSAEDFTIIEEKNEHQDG